MKVLLINPYPYYASGVEGVIYPPIGLLYIAAAVKERSLAEVRVLDANVLKLDNSGVISEIEGYRPDVIGVSSNIVTHQGAIELMELIVEKGLKPSLLIAGGPYPVLFPGKYLEYCDMVINGEGEITFCDILEAAGKGKDAFLVKGLTHKRGGELRDTGKRELIDDLDSIPFPDYRALKPEIAFYSRKSRVVKKVMAPITTSRGCPYQCTYCNKSVFGSKFRYRSPENILQEIKWLGDNFGVDQLDILDDNFNLIPERAEKVLDGIMRGGRDIGISCHNGLRADKIDENLAKKLKKSGVFKVGIGIETADPALLDSVKKNLDLNKVKEAIKLLRRHGITVHGYFILGLPGDTPESMARTIKFAKEANPHFCNFATCIPFPGTEVYEKVKREGRFLTDVDDGVKSGFFDGRVFFEIGPTREEDVRSFYKKAYREFYFNPAKALDILFSIRSLKEFQWLVGTAASLVLNTLLKKKSG